MTFNKSKGNAVPTNWQPGFLSELDNRTSIARELRQRLNALMTDLGGSDFLSYAQRALCERVIWLEYWLQQEETKLATGNPDNFDVGKWVQACNALTGSLKSLGLERRSQRITLQNYIESANKT